MVTFSFLAALYAESRLQYEWHDDQCACSKFPESCGTYNESEYFWRRNVPSSWGAEAVTEKVMEFIALIGDGADRATHEYTEAAAMRSANGDEVDDELLVFELYPIQKDR